jgi:hypothetical protein
MQHERPGKHHTLQLSTRKLVRIFIEKDFGGAKIHTIKSLNDAGIALFFIVINSVNRAAMRVIGHVEIANLEEGHCLSSFLLLSNDGGQRHGFALHHDP